MKCEKGLADGAEPRLVAQEIVAKAVNLERLFRHGAFGVDVLVIGPAGRHVVEQLHRADFDDAVAFGGFKARWFRCRGRFHAFSVSDMADQGQDIARLVEARSRVSMMWVARSRFSASGIWRARMRREMVLGHAGAGKDAGALQGRAGR